jgi:hypothetical protein
MNTMTGRLRKGESHLALTGRAARRADARRTAHTVSTGKGLRLTTHVDRARVIAATR